MVEIDPDVMGGAPVIAGTRIPVSAISDMLSQGATVEEITEGYPSLSAEQVRLAGLYDAAHPIQDRSLQPLADPNTLVRKSVYPLQATKTR